MTRVFSGIQPSGPLHIGNLLGALVNWASMQDDHDGVYCVVDLHSLTLPHEPAQLRANTIELAQLLIAIGIDPERSILFVQSQVPEHAQCAWLMECTVSYGELSRMTAFKDKSNRDGTKFVSAGLFTYPALQAADILLYDTDFVPVGDDQRQHVEITRDIATRFNSRYGETFVVPAHVIQPAGARVMDLQHPENKMSKSVSGSGTVGVLDDFKSIEKKFKRAVTDSESEVRFDVENKPGVSNLLSILSAATGKPIDALAGQYTQYGPLKADTAEAVIDVLRPIQARFAELQADPGKTERLLAVGAAKASEIAGGVLARAKHNIGLL